MTTSIRSQIVDAIYTAVNGAGKPSGLTVTRSRTTPFAKADLLPAGKVIVYRTTEEVMARASNYKTRRALTVRCECRVAATDDGETLEDALDPLTSWVVQAVQGVATLQGGTGMLADKCIELTTQWAVADEDAVYGAAAVDFRIEYITAAGNPDTA
jgi:X-X-X-Leu-X-X-Gly heptad repeat protein